MKSASTSQLRSPTTSPLKRSMDTCPDQTPLYKMAKLQPSQSSYESVMLGSQDTCSYTPLDLECGEEEEIIDDEVIEAEDDGDGIIIDVD